MTALEFGKRDGRIDTTTILCVLLLIVSVSAYAVLYIHQVSMRRDIKQVERNIEKAQVVNAELKNDIYSVLDSISAEAVLEARGLVVDRSPEYALPSVVAKKNQPQ